MLERIKKLLKLIIKYIKIFTVSLLIIRGIFVWSGRYTYGSKIYKVTDKGIDNGLNLIYTDKGTLQIKDSLLYLQYASSDVYGSIEKGSCYKFHKHLFYFRIPILTSYNNIISFKKISCN